MKRGGGRDEHGVGKLKFGGTKSIGLVMYLSNNERLFRHKFESRRIYTPTLLSQYQVKV